jgi:hypothetical protein
MASYQSSVQYRVSLPSEMSAHSEPAIPIDKVEQQQDYKRQVIPSTSAGLDESTRGGCTRRCRAASKDLPAKGENM